MTYRPRRAIEPEFWGYQKKWIALYCLGIGAVAGGTLIQPTKVAYIPGGSQPTQTSYVQLPTATRGEPCLERGDQAMTTDQVVLSCKRNDQGKLRWSRQKENP